MMGVVLSVSGNLVVVFARLVLMQSEVMDM